MNFVLFFIVCVICFFIGAVISFVVTMAYQDYWFKKKADEVRKFKELFNFATSWIAYKQSGHSISEKIKRNGYEQVAVYGMGILGELAIQELEKDGIKVSFGLDKNADIMYRKLPLFTPEDEFPETDAIIITAISSFDEISKELNCRTKIPTVNLKSLV